MKSIIKWAGSKRRLVPRILGALPVLKSADRCTFWEPFFGAGHVTHALSALGRLPQCTIASDINAELMNVHFQVRDNLTRLASELAALKAQYLEATDRAAVYYAWRDEFNRGSAASPVLEAALFIALNKTGFNGLYRVNQLGAFNVPHGRYENPAFLSIDDIIAVSTLMQPVDIAIGGMAAYLTMPRPGDVVYADPPYYGTFSSYASGGFTDSKDQVKLAAKLNRLADIGVYVVASNADCPEIRDMYRAEAGWDHIVLSRSQVINSDKTGRGKVSELLMVNKKNWRT